MSVVYSGRKGQYISKAIDTGDSLYICMGSSWWQKYRVFKRREFFQRQL